MLWVDPVVDLTKPLPPAALTIEDAAGEHTVELETALADNGDAIAFGELIPREPGVYEVTSYARTSDILVQDRWDTEIRAWSTGKAVAPLREATEVFIRYPPDDTPRPRAVLRESHKGKLVNLLRNGDFEAGLPDYPPRGWNVYHPRRDDPGWPGWSQESPVEGNACLKFVRPKERVRANSQPMRLRTGGRYVLRFQAKGNATTASVLVAGQRGTSASVSIEPTDDWTAYRVELDAHPGHCMITIQMNAGGEPDRVLWVDDMEFGYIG